MKKLAVLLLFVTIAPPLFARPNVNRIVPGAEAQLSTLLNSPAMIRPAAVTSLGRGWFTLETDAHVFTDQVSLSQLVDMLNDLENYASFFDGRRSKTSAAIVSQSEDELIADFVSVGIVIGFQIRTPFRATLRTLVNTDSRHSVETRQLAEDSQANGRIRNLVAIRYIEEVTIGGKKYTYIRIYSTMDIDASILPGARGVMERNLGPINIEDLEMMIAAAKLF
jgi:hypothetical protein